MEAVAAEGWEFNSWVGDVGNSDSANTTLYMDNNKTVTAIFEENISDPNTISADNSVVNISGEIDYDIRLEDDLVLAKNMNISLAEVKLNIILKNSTGEFIEDGDYPVTIISNISGKILDNKNVSFVSGDGSAAVDLTFLNKGIHSLSVVFDSIQIEKSLGVNIEANDLHIYNANIDLNGYDLSVEGKLIQSKGNIDVNSGNLFISEDYRLQNINEDNEYEKTSGRLTIVNESSRISFNSEYNLNKRSDVNLSHNYLEMNPGNTIQLTSSFPMESNNQVYWSSRDTDIVDINNNGLVSALANGYSAVKITSANDSSVYVYLFNEIN